MSDGLSEDEAERLAATIREACAHEVCILLDGPQRVVQVTLRTSGTVETFYLYDEADWSWLSDRILRS